MNRPFCSLALIALASGAFASSSQAALLTSFSDDFNRPDQSGLGSNWTETSVVPRYSIVNNTALDSIGGETNAYVNLGTLPTATDFANGYSFTASVDVYIESSLAVPVIGMLLNYQNNSNYGAIAFRGGGNNLLRYVDRFGGSQANTNGNSVASSLTDQTWYTLTVSGSIANQYAYSWALQGSSTSLTSGTFVLTASNSFTGGSIGLWNDSTPGANSYTYDNFTVTVNAPVPEPATQALCVGGLGAVVLARRKFFRRTS